MPTSEDLRRELAESRLIDDDFMRMCLKGRTDCLEHIVRTVTGDDGVKVVDMREQEDMPSFLAHGARLDFTCEASDGRVFNVEVESSAERFPPRRARFYASALDRWSFPPGADYSELPDATVIALCGGDALGSGLGLATVRRRVEEDGSPFGDGSAIIYVDCTVEDDTPLGRLAHDMMCADPEQMNSSLLADCARGCKEMGGREMGSVLKDAYEVGVEDGMERGMQRGMERGMERGAALERQRLLDLMRAQGVDPAVIAQAELAPAAPQAG